MYIITWEYHINPDHRAKFEETYAPDGLWAVLFKKGAGYLGTELIQSIEFPDQYVTIDRWTSSEAYDAFLSQWKAEYDRLDAQCDDLTTLERRLGTYQHVTTF